MIYKNIKVEYITNIYYNILLIIYNYICSIYYKYIINYIVNIK